MMVRKRLWFRVWLSQAITMFNVRVKKSMLSESTSEVEISAWTVCECFYVYLQETRGTDELVQPLPAMLLERGVSE